MSEVKPDLLKECGEKLTKEGKLPGAIWIIRADGKVDISTEKG